MAASAVNVAPTKCLDGRTASLRGRGARFSIMDGMSRDAAEELCSWEPAEVMEWAYSTARPEEVAPEVRADLHRATAWLEVDECLKGLLAGYKAVNVC